MPAADVAVEALKVKKLVKREISPMDMPSLGIIIILQLPTSDLEKSLKKRRSDNTYKVYI